MKKLSLLVGGLILSGAVMAQKPSSDVPMTLEGILGLNAGAAGGTNLSFTAPAIRFRYFLTDNIAARVTFGINNSRDKFNAYENPDFTGATGEYTMTTNGWNVGIGGEYHFAGTDRLSPFGALNIMFGGTNFHDEGTNATTPINPDGTATYVADYSEDFEGGTSMFGVALTGGVDYYFAENFYIGLELGLGWMTTKTKETTAEVTAGGTTVSSTVPSTNSNNSIFTSDMTGMVPTGNFRLGWRF
jgi:outer membrane protein W